MNSRTRKYPAKFILSTTVTAFAGALLVGCGGGDKEGGKSEGGGADTTVDESRDNSAEVQAYYDANPDFFTFATPEDIPADLTWENGADLPELGSDKATKGGTWHKGLTDFPRTFRHFGPDANGSFRWYLTDLSMNYAHRHPNVEQGYFPGLAKEWAIDEENVRVFIRINENAEWSDGVPVTTADAAFNYYLKQTEFNQAPWYQNFFKVQYKNITVYDEHTFSVTVAQKKPDFASYVLELGPEPKHFYKGYQDDFVQYYQWKVRPTTAAYVIDESSVKKGKSLQLVRQKDWWAKDLKFWKNRYNPDVIDLEVVRDPEKSFELFLNGDMEVARLNLAKYWFDKLPDDHPLVQKGYIHKVTFYNKVPTGGMGFYLNTTKPLLDDINVRKGIAHASDFATVVDKFFRNQWALENATNSGYGAASSDSLRAREYDPKQAAEYFAKAGFNERGPDGILVNDKGQRLSFTVTTGAKTLTDALTILQQQALKAGLELKLEIVDNTVAWKKAQEKKHEITLTGFGYSTTEVYPRYWEAWHGENAFNDDGSVKVQTNNYTMLNEPVINEKIIQYRESVSHEEKVKLAHELEQLIWDSGVYAYGFYLPAYRVGYWRGIEWPEGFNVMRSELEWDYMVHWIDEAKLKETMEAKASGKTFEPLVKEYDQFKN